MDLVINANHFLLRSFTLHRCWFRILLFLFPKTRTILYTLSLNQRDQPFSVYD